MLKSLKRVVKTNAKLKHSAEVAKLVELAATCSLPVRLKSFVPSAKKRKKYLLLLVQAKPKNLVAQANVDQTLKLKKVVPVNNIAEQIKAAPRKIGAAFFIILLQI